MQLFAPGALNPILERIKAEVRAIETDISTPDGRKAISSLAYKIARTKTFIDGQRVVLVGEEKKRLAAIDTEGRRVREELDALRDEVEKPLTDWKNAELQRTARCEALITTMTDIASATFISVDNVDRASRVLDLTWDHNFQEFSKRATQAHEKALLRLQSEKQRLQQAEADRAERERLRIEAEEKARIEREAKIAEDARLAAEAKAKREADAEVARVLEREALQKQEAEIERKRIEEVAREREQTAERNRAEERERLERERKESEAKLQKSLDEARAKAQREKLAAEERERKAEADRIAERNRAEAEREAAVKAERKRQEDIRQAEEEGRRKAEAERLRREKDKTHRQEVQNEAFLALVGQVQSLNTASGRAVIKAIADGLIPNVVINY